MITLKRADELQVGDVFSTDGYKVERTHQLWDGRIIIYSWLDASGGIKKTATFKPDVELPIWTPDEVS